LIAMTILLLVFAALGFGSPSNRGALLTWLLLSFVFMGVFAGYVSTRAYTMWELPSWKHNTFFTAMFLPTVMFVMLLLLNLVVLGEKASGTVSFSTLLALLVLWLGISVPLVYMGAYMAYKRPKIEPTTKVNNIPRLMLPDPAWYNSPNLAMLMGGLLPFGSCFIEFFFIMSSVWQHQYYYMFGILFLVFFILVITCAEISIVTTYFLLCSENYHWWWRAFFTSGSSGFYLFVYSIVYFVTKLDITKVDSATLYFGYMMLVAIAFTILTGTIGSMASFYFLRKIYSCIKID
jgi:transmembrane 9 superfamily protein 2/4